MQPFRGVGRLRRLQSLRPLLLLTGRLLLLPLARHRLLQMLGKEVDVEVAAGHAEVGASESERSLQELVNTLGRGIF